MSTEQLQKRLLIGNKRGLHARAAAKFVTLAAEFEADIEVERNGQSVSVVPLWG